jgi:hypothetical protein
LLDKQDDSDDLDDSDDIKETIKQELRKEQLFLTKHPDVDDFEAFSQEAESN